MRMLSPEMLNVFGCEMGPQPGLRLHHGTVVGAFPVRAPAADASNGVGTHPPADAPRDLSTPPPTHATVYQQPLDEGTVIIPITIWRSSSSDFTDDPISESY